MTQCNVNVLCSWSLYRTPILNFFFDIPEHIHSNMTVCVQVLNRCTRDLYQPNGTRVSNLPIYGAICHEPTRRRSQTTKKMLLRVSSTSTLEHPHGAAKSSNSCDTRLRKIHVASGWIKTRKITEHVDATKNKERRREALEILSSVEEKRRRRSRRDWQKKRRGRRGGRRF